MEKSHAHHILLELIKKSGQQRHYDALMSLYTPVEKSTNDRYPEDWFDSTKPETDK